MKTYSLLFLLLISASAAMAQEFSSYAKPIQLFLYSEALGDSVSLEITLPTAFENQTNTSYPVIYLLDRQLQSNYTYNLNTIDYLSTLRWMPSAVVVGITFPWRNRNSWTNPNATGGQADDLIRFLTEELNEELKKKYPISTFNLLVGHSRTAIFSSYALSKSPEFFNGAVASSVSNFDFGSEDQQRQFEVFLDKIPSFSHSYFYYFSVGEEAYGDLHEAAVDTLNAYLSSKKLPENLEWKFYKHQIAHELTPGVTVCNALSEIFKAYGRRIDVCFNLAEKSREEVPWTDFLGLYSSISADLGFTVEPTELFFNSIASAYYYDYDGIYGDKNLDFALEILLKAVETYPNQYDYYGWIGEIYLTLNEPEKGEHYLNKSIELLMKDKTISELDRQSYLNEIEGLKKTN